MTSCSIPTSFCACCAPTTPSTTLRPGDFEEADKGKLRLIVPMLVVAETVFVLQGLYRIERAEIAKLIKDLAVSPGIVLLESTVVTRAVEIFGTQGIDFADAYIAALAEETRTTTLATSNKRDFRRFERLRLVP